MRSHERDNCISLILVPFARPKNYGLVRILTSNKTLAVDLSRLGLVFVAATSLPPFPILSARVRKILHLVLMRSLIHLVLINIRIKKYNGSVTQIFAANGNRYHSLSRTHKIVTINVWQQYSSLNNKAWYGSRTSVLKTINLRLIINNNRRYQ